MKWLEDILGFQDLFGVEEVIAVAVLFAFVGGEMLIGALRQVKIYEKADTFANLVLGFVTFSFMLLIKGLHLSVFVFFYQFAFLELDMSAWYNWLLLIVVMDFFFYLLHRFIHVSRFFYAFHAAHHNSKQFNFSVSVRGFFALQFLKYPLWVLLPLMGFAPWAVLIADSIIYLYQMWVHTELIGNLGPLEWIMNTPEHHRVHHSDKPEHIDKNCAGMFIIWDRIFGTFVKVPREEIQYGITNGLEGNNPVNVALHEFVEIAKDIRQPASPGKRFWLLFGRPFPYTDEDRQ